MKFKNIATVACSIALGMMVFTSCEGGDLYKVNAPDWLADKIAEAAEQGGEEEEELVGMHEDVYTVGATDFSTGWWAAFSKYYQIPDGEKFNVVFNLSINPNASNTYKNYAMIITNDEDRGAANYKEYGAIRYDNQPSGNSEWGDYIDRGAVESTLTFNTDTDAGVEKLGGRVVVTIDRTDPNAFIVKMSNGTVTKTYTQNTPLTALNADGTNSPIRVFFVPEGSYINFLQANIEPIGGYTSAEDKQPLSMTLNGVPKKVMLGTDFEAAFANISATVQFEQEVSKVVPVAELALQAVPDMSTTGTKTLVAAYNKTFKGEGAAKPIIATIQFEVVDKMYTTIGAADNSGDFWSAHSDNIKVAAGETFVSSFTNYTNGASNWNNFCVVLCKADNSEYAVVRADNYGWGNGYDACTPTFDNGGDWVTWLAAMDGAKVTTYVTNNGNGTADVKAVMEGNDGRTFTQEYTGINTVDANDFYFRFTIDHSHIEFDDVVGAEDNSGDFWSAHSDMIKVPSGKTYSTRFRNFTNGAANWNNFCVVLTKADNSEYAVVRSDNYGWGDSYDACTPTFDNGGDWVTWLAAMDEAMVTVSVTNNGSSADVKCVMIGNDGRTFTQEYKGISPITGDDLYFRMTVDHSHLIFE
jgi:hypothetical protein